MALEIIHNDKKEEKSQAPPKIIRTPVTILENKINVKESVNIGKVWTNNNTKVIRNIYCIVPYSILQIMNSFEERMSSKNIEFAIFVKGELRENVLVVKEDFYVPTQEVTSVAIEFKEDHKDYNGVIHRHPSGVMNFSGTDETYINQNFTFSLLYVERKITKGIYNLDVPNFGRVRLDLDINFAYKEMPSLKKFENKIFTTYTPQVKVEKVSKDKILNWGKDKELPNFLRGMNQIFKDQVNEQDKDEDDEDDEDNSLFDEEDLKALNSDDFDPNDIRLQDLKQDGLVPAIHHD